MSALGSEFSEKAPSFMPPAEPELVAQRTSYALFRTAGCDIAIHIRDKNDGADKWIGMTGTPRHIAGLYHTLFKDKMTENGLQKTSIEVLCIFDLKSTFQDNKIRPEISDAIASYTPDTIVMAMNIPSLKYYTTFTEAHKIWNEKDRPGPRELGMI